MNDCGYGDFSEEFSVNVMDCTSVRENETSDIDVYPNPADNLIVIEFNGFKETDMEIGVLNILGNTIYSANGIPSGENFKLQTSDWADGIYFLRISDPSHTITKKIIIQH